MFDGEGRVYPNIFCGHRLEPEDGSLRVINDVVSAAEIFLVELQVEFI